MQDAPTPPEGLLARIAEITSGLLFPSESDHPLTPYQLGEGEPSPELLFAELDVPVGSPIETLTAEEFFAPVLAPEEDGGAPPEEAARYRELLDLLQGHLADVQVHRVGRYDVDVVIIGRHPSGAWLGLRTHLVET